MIAHAEFQSSGADVSRTESVAKHRPRSDQSESVSLMVLVFIVVVSMTMVFVVAVAASMIVLSIVPAALVIRLVFSGPYEVHRPITCIILSAMLPPIPGVAGRYV